MTQAEDTAQLVHTVLGEDAVAGVYRHGSAVLGGTRPRSDVDVLAVTRRRTTPDERRALVDGLLRISGPSDRPGPVRPVELTVVVQDDVRPWRYPPRCEFQYGEWLRPEYERGVVPAPSPSPDLAPLITMVLLGNTPLAGPPPHHTLAPVPPHDLRRAMVTGIPELLADLEEDTRNVVLTLARIWHTLATGTFTTKDAAVDWALPRLPPRHRPVPARARAVYLDQHPDHWTDLHPRLRPYATHLTRTITRLTGIDAPGGSGSGGR
ncbi:aminoglycoside adenylyltransferase family protein [Streptomyces sclerotialus]|uniref:aminoglycoside adenylyltransferase family protein n=1 Tax=Streptomyces sclerotialus TaxID=1957 RepID=UPI000691A4F4